jgi:hypothetical protein
MCTRKQRSYILDKIKLYLKKLGGIVILLTIIPLTVVAESTIGRRNFKKVWKSNFSTWQRYFWYI